MNINTTDFRDLPPDVKRELAYNSIQLTLACTALSKLTNNSPEYWAGQISGNAYQMTQDLDDATITQVIEKIETQRQTGYGAIKVEIKTEPRGFGK